MKTPTSAIVRSIGMSAVLTVIVVLATHEGHSAIPKKRAGASNKVTATALKPQLPRYTLNCDLDNELEDAQQLSLQLTGQIVGTRQVTVSPEGIQKRNITGTISFILSDANRRSSEVGVPVHGSITRFPSDTQKAQIWLERTPDANQVFHFEKSFHRLVTWIASQEPESAKLDFSSRAVSKKIAETLEPSALKCEVKRTN